MAMDIDGGRDMEEMSRRIQVRFVTKLKPPLRVPPIAISIPTSLTRLGLSSANNLLNGANPDWEAEPCEQFLLAKGTSVERVLEIEYIKDWVNAVDGSNPRFTLTGCNDGLGRIWKAPGQCTHIMEGHLGAVTSVSVVNSDGAKSAIVATTPKDRTVRLWKLKEESMTKIKAYKILHGHNAFVQSVAAQDSGDKVCSGSTNELDAAGDLVAVKKRKVKNEDKESDLEGEAVSTLVGHTQCVSSVVWPERGTIYSTSWDHAIRRWDVETSKDFWNPGEAVSTLVGHTQCASSVVWPERGTIYSISWDHAFRRWDVETSRDLWNPFYGKAFNCLDVGGEGSASPIQFGSVEVFRDPVRRHSGRTGGDVGHGSYLDALRSHGRGVLGVRGRGNEQGDRGRGTARNVQGRGRGGWGEAPPLKPEPSLKHFADNDRRDLVTHMELSFIFLGVNRVRGHTCCVHGGWGQQEIKNGARPSSYEPIAMDPDVVKGVFERGYTGIYDPFDFKPSQEQQALMHEIWNPPGCKDNFWAREFRRHGVLFKGRWNCQQYFENVLDRGQSLLRGLDEVFWGLNRGKLHDVMELRLEVKKKCGQACAFTVKTHQGVQTIAEVRFMYEVLDLEGGKTALKLVENPQNEDYHGGMVRV